VTAVSSRDSIAITTKVGERFQIDVQSVPTAGYLWEAEVPKGKARLLEHVMPKADASTIGGGGMERFVFEAKARGEFTIRLINKRPWEAEPLSTQDYRVVVR
jgi:inhibitor of cysteine peptidase